MGVTGDEARLPERRSCPFCRDFWFSRRGSVTEASAGLEASKARSSSGSVALAEYRRRKLELADLIREVMSVAAERRDEEGAESARELLGRLAEDRFQLAVVGQFSRGKSTLMNAILGRAYLPTGALPMTSVVTTVRYGSRPRVFVRRAGGRLPIESSLGELVRFVAQSSREREELRVVSVEVEVPAEILRLGFSFVDTPGIGSAIAQQALAALRCDRDRCPVCLAIATAEHDAVTDVVAKLPPEPGDKAAPALCVLHLASVLAADPGIERARWIVQRLADVLERAAADMRTYALKREARGQRYSDEERAAHQQVIAYLAGDRQLARPWRLDEQ